MNLEDARAFADQWAQAWNRRDLGAVLKHFHETVVFSSPRAVDAVGVPTVIGRKKLKDYWERALGRISQLEFAVNRVLWDGSRSELAIIYDREVNGHRDRAVEVLRFDGTGLVVAGEVFYGVQPRP